METNKIYLGDCIKSLQGIPDNSVDCCVTSPPYYALRDYGTGHWEGGDPNCTHEKTLYKHPREEGKQSGNAGSSYNIVSVKTCPDCGARYIDDQIGLEETPEAYIAKLTEVFEQVRRVLKPEGTLWLNIGDSYWGGGWRGADVSEFSGDIQKGSKGTHCGLTMPTCKGENRGGVQTQRPYRYSVDACFLPSQCRVVLTAGHYLAQA